MKRLAIVGAMLGSSVAFVGPTPTAAIANPSLIWVAYVHPAGNTLSHTSIEVEVGESFTLENRRNQDTGVSYVSIVNGTGSVTLDGTNCATDSSCPVYDKTTAPPNQGVFTVTSSGSVTVRRYLFSQGSGSTSEVGTLTLQAAASSALPSQTVSFDPNGGSCAIGGDVKTTTFTVSGFPVKFPNADACQRVGYRLVGWQSSSSTAMPGDSVTSSGTTFVAQWEGWVADGSQAGGGILGGLGSSVSMSGDGTVVAGGGFFANTRVHRRSTPSSGWSDAIVHDKVVGIMSTVDVSGDGSTLASTWGLWIGLPGIGDGVVRSSIPSDGSRLRLEALAPTLGVVANPLTTRSVSMSRDGSVQAIGERSGGSTGEGLVKIRDSSGSLAEFLGEARGDGFGASVAVSADGSTVVVGAPLNDWAGSDAGSVRVYRRFGVGWFQSTIVGEAAGDNFGFSVAVSANGNTIVVGAPFNDGAGVNSGQVRVFDWNDNRWTQRGRDIDGAVTGDQAGHSVAVSGDGNVLAFGSPYASMPDWDRQRQLGERCWYPPDGLFTPLIKGLIDTFLACDGLEGGRVDVMRWTAKSWNPVGLPIPGDSRRRVGFSVDMSADGTKLVVGAPGLSGTFDLLLYGGELREYRLE